MKKIENSTLTPTGICHSCEQMAGDLYTCEWCDELICSDCLVGRSSSNNIEKNICNDCYERSKNNPTP